MATGGHDGVRNRKADNILTISGHDGTLNRKDSITIIGIYEGPWGRYGNL